MPYRTIVEWPHPILKIKLDPVVKFDDSTKNIAIDLEDTLRVCEGGGIAANQVGINARMLLIDCSKFGIDFVNPESDSSVLENKNMWLIINPVIKSPEGETEWTEGCLSVPWHNAKVKRSTNILLEYYTLSGELKEVSLTFPISAAVQHEVDHLDGKLYLDRIGKLAASRIKKSITKKRKKLKNIRKVMLAQNTEEDKKPKRKRQSSHLSKNEIKKRKSHKRANR